MEATFVRCASCEPCEKFKRKTFTPASAKALIVSGELDAGPSVETIFVKCLCFICEISLKFRCFKRDCFAQAFGRGKRFDACSRHAARCQIERIRRVCYGFDAEKILARGRPHDDMTEIAVRRNVDFAFARRPNDFRLAVKAAETGVQFQIGDFQSFFKLPFGLDFNRFFTRRRGFMRPHRFVFEFDDGIGVFGKNG